MPNFYGFGRKNGTSSNDVRVLSVGLDLRGSTELLYKLKLGEWIKTIPTIGFNVETVAGLQGTKKKLTIWDIGGQDKLRPLFRHYISDTNIVIWMVDANDPQRFAESAVEFNRLFGHFVSDQIDLANVGVLFVVNKIDLVDGVSLDRVKLLLDDAFDFCALEDRFGAFEYCQTSLLTDDGLEDLKTLLVRLADAPGRKHPKRRSAAPAAQFAALGDAQ